MENLGGTQVVGKGIMGCRERVDKSGCVYVVHKKVKSCCVFSSCTANVNC
jgi:hypothetical protein